MGRSMYLSIDSFPGSDKGNRCTGDKETSCLLCKNKVNNVFIIRQIAHFLLLLRILKHSFSFPYMKNLLQSVALCLGCLLLYGCPYESTVPIDTPKLPVDEKLLGQWVSDAESYNEYFITKANNTQYRVQQKSVTGNTAWYLAHISEIKGATFLNLYSDSTNTYYLYRVILNPDGAKCSLVPVSQTLNEQFQSSAALRQYIEKNMNLRSFYNNDDAAEFLKLQ